MIRTRIAPSPTGTPHIGTAWQALFDFVFAKKNNGKFILRLEDTDRLRFVAESEKEIYEALDWLEFEVDEGPNIGGPFGPYVQSERLDIYKKYSNELISKGLAYQDEGAIRFKINKEGQTVYHDLVGNRNITIENSTQEDFVILKSDRFPTYNFANVVDDHLMEISHVIRGNEYISSMPKYLQLYKSFGWQPPQFAHLPLLLGSDRSKLSKRHGAKGVLEFKREGYLKEVLINFLALLGWSHPQGKEIFSLQEMIEVFDFKDFNFSSAFFDITKLDWLNGEYIRKSQNSKLKTQIYEYLHQVSDESLSPDSTGVSTSDHPTEEEIDRVIPLVKERIKKLSDFIPLTNFLWEKPEYDKTQFQKLKVKNQNKALINILNKLEEMKKPWKFDIFESTFRDLAKDLELSASQMFQLIRVAISGQTITPPLFESIQILGEEETIKRIKEASNNCPS